VAAQRLMTHPGVGALTTLAYVLNHWRSRTLRGRQAGGELPGTRAAGKIERQAGALF